MRGGRGGALRDGRNGAVRGGRGGAVRGRRASRGGRAGGAWESESKAESWFRIISCLFFRVFQLLEEKARADGVF